MNEYAFRGLLALQELTVYRCQLSIPPPITPIARTLRHLRLIANDLTYMPAGYFTDRNILETISLSGNRLSVVPDVRILNATLRKFILSDNIITLIESLYFVPMITLKTLDLAQNLITEVEFGHSIWPSIAIIILKNNRLTTIKIADLGPVSGKVLVQVGGNPWHCDVELCWLSHCQYKMSRMADVWSKCRGSVGIQVLGDMVCNSPDERRNVAINESGEDSLGINAQIIFRRLNARLQ